MTPAARREIEEQLEAEQEPIDYPDLDWPEPKSTIIQATVVSRTTRPEFTLEEDQ